MLVLVQRLTNAQHLSRPQIVSLANADGFALTWLAALPGLGHPLAPSKVAAMCAIFPTWPVLQWQHSNLHILPQVCFESSRQCVRHDLGMLRSVWVGEPA